MRVNIYVCVYISTHTATYTHMYIYIHTSILLSTKVYTHDRHHYMCTVHQIRTTSIFRIAFQNVYSIHFVQSCACSRFLSRRVDLSV